MDYNQASSLFINQFLLIYALIGWYFLDNSLAGLLLSILTSLAGPMVELILINNFHLYFYKNADYYGICSWIPWVYFFGGSAVGNLSRSIHYKINSST